MYYKGPQSVSFIRRLSSLQRLKCTSIMENGPRSASFIERFFSIVLSVFCRRLYCTHFSRRLASGIWATWTACPLREGLMNSMVYHMLKMKDVLLIAMASRKIGRFSRSLSSPLYSILLFVFISPPPLSLSLSLSLKAWCPSIRQSNNHWATS